MNEQSLKRQAVATRRAFLQTAASAALVSGLAPILPAQDKPAAPLKLSIFSKHLQWLDWEPMAQAAAEVGFDGVDLTVRKGGHVEPERVEQDLPKAAAAIRKAGLELTMATTDIVNVQSPHAEAVLRAISGVGVKYYRWGDFRYVENKPLPEQLEALKKDAARLAELNRRYKLCAMYHTHSGDRVGASIWDLWLIIKDLDPAALGVNYDVAHATIEGGLGGWLASTRLVAPLTRGIALKDFRWEKDAKGQWRPQWCPLGEGMVNFKRYFTMLREAKFSGPVQVHYEYPLGGADKGNRTLTMDKAQILAAMRKDLTTLKGWLREAQLA